MTWTATTDEYVTNAGYVPVLAGAVRALLDVRPGERVLDVGCGDGAVAAELQAAGAVVVGLDAAEDMVGATRARGVEAHVGDAAALDGVDGPFDAVFSNAALHWVADAAGAARAARRVLRPGGRLAAEFGGHGNVAAVRVALRAALDEIGHGGVTLPAWYFPTPAAHRAVLEEAGLVVATIELVARPTIVEVGLRGWLATFAGTVRAAVADDWAAVLARTEELAARVLRDDTGVWTVDYVRLRVLAHRPEEASR